MCSIANASTKQPVVYFRACLSEDVVMHSKAECHKVGWLSRLGILYSLILYSFDNKRLWSQGPWEKKKKGKRRSLPTPHRPNWYTRPHVTNRDRCQGSVPPCDSFKAMKVVNQAKNNIIVRTTSYSWLDLRYTIIQYWVLQLSCLLDDLLGNWIGLRTTRALKSCSLIR